MLNSERQAIMLDLEEEAKIRQASDLTPGYEKEKASRTRPQIVTTDRPIREVSGDSLEALREANVPPTIFARSGDMVHIVNDESGRSSIRTVDAAFLRGRMDRAANYVRISKGEAHAVPPPNEAVSDILAQDAGCWKFPPLTSLVEVPILRPDGTVLSTPGYDVTSKVYYAPPSGIDVPRIPEEPNPDDIRHALSFVMEAFGEFPYADQASWANTLALLLTPIVRLAINGPVPLALLDAPQSGTGKSLLTKVLSQVAAGSDAAMMSAPKEEEEWRKSITAVLRAGSPIIIYDNVTRVLQSASLAMVLTAGLTNVVESAAKRERRRSSTS